MDSTLVRVRSLRRVALLARRLPREAKRETRLLETLEVLVRAPWRVVSPTEAVLYRKIEAAHPTLLLDEMDTIFGRGRNDAHEPLRALLNAGNRRGVRVPRCMEERGTQRLVEFSTFTPRVLAGIGTLPDTVADRSIPIRLQRRAAHECVEKFRFREATEAAQPIREALERWAASAGNQLDQARPAIPPALHDRAGELWEPLLAIADLAGSEWPRRVREAALALHADPPAQTETIGVQFLAAIRAIFDEQGTGEIPTPDLLDALVDRDDTPAAEWWSRALKDGGTKGAARRLANLLKQYGIEPRKWGSGKDTQRGYRRADFENAWSRYLPAAAPPQAGGLNAADAASLDTQGPTGDSVDAGPNAAASLTPQRKPLQDKGCGVAASTPPVPWVTPGNGQSGGEALSTGAPCPEGVSPDIAGDLTPQREPLQGKAGDVAASAPPVLAGQDDNGRRETLRVLAASRGWPRIYIGAGESVPAGPELWATFLAKAGDDRIAWAIAALRFLTQTGGVPSEGSGAGQSAPAVPEEPGTP